MAELWYYLATEASESVATRFIEGLQSVFARAAEVPLAGARRDELAPGLRVMFHGNYAVYYLPHDQQLVIVRVLHGARDIAAIAAAGGLSTGS